MPDQSAAAPARPAAPAPAPPGGRPGPGEPRPGPVRRLVSRITVTQAEHEARELRAEARDAACTLIAEAPGARPVTLCGTLRSVTLRPRSGVPALEAELYDGSGRLLLVWLGRRRIAGIEPGRTLVVRGRITSPATGPVIYNPRYDLKPTAAS